MFFVFCGLGMAYTFRVSASKCGHQNAQRQIATFVTGETLADVSKKVHPDEADELESLGFIGQEETGFEIDWATPVENLDRLGVTAISLKCSAPVKIDPPDVPVREEKMSGKNAFELIMSKAHKRRLPREKLCR